MYPRCGRLYIFSGCCQFIGVNIRESLQQRTIADAFDNCFKRWTDRQTDRQTGDIISRDIRPYVVPYLHVRVARFASIADDFMLT